MSHLLDTNTIVDHLRKGAKSKVTSRLEAAPAGSVYLCSVVLDELLYGAFHTGPDYEAKNLELIATLRTRFASLPFDDPAAETYGRLREDLSAKGQLIGPNDLLIASIALANGFTLVTRNEAEFSRVPGLSIENWV